MLQKQIYLLLLLLSLSIPAIAQIEITGQVLDSEDLEPIEQATVVLLDQNDQRLIKGGVSNADGRFNLIGMREGRFLLQVRFMGYETWEQTITLQQAKSPYKLDTFKLKRAANMLEEVTVKGRVAEMKVNNDTIEYQADAYKLTEGTNLEGLLKKMPGIEVGQDGKISIQGKEVKKILVDGKEFFSQDPTIASKNLPANMVNKLQSYDKKSDMSLMTGFDDGEDEHVINLVIKPNMKQGWLGNAYAGYGSKGRYEANMMLNRLINRDQWSVIAGSNNTNNMGSSDIAGATQQRSYGGGGRRGGQRGSGGGGNRDGGVTTSGNLGVNFSKEFTPQLIVNGDITLNKSTNLLIGKNNKQNLLPNNMSSYDLSHYENTRTGENGAANLRVEWKPDTLTQLILTADGAHNRAWRNDHYASHNLNDDRDSINSTDASMQENSRGQQLFTRLEISRRLNKRGRTLSGSAGMSLNNSASDELNSSTIRYFLAADSTDQINQQSRYDNRSTSFRGSLAWTEPLTEKSALQASVRIATAQRTLQRNSYTQDAAGEYTLLDSTNSVSTHNKTAEYRFNLSFRWNEKKFRYMIGINLDPSFATTTTLIGEQPLHTFNRRPLNISPMARFHYQMRKQTNLNLDYYGRTAQPTMRQLQPKPDVTDPLNRIVGNPQLSPSYSHNLRFHLFHYAPEKQSGLFLSGYGTYTINDVVANTSYDKERGVRETTYENVTGNYRGDLRVTYNTPLANQRFSINSTSRISFSRTEGFINGVPNSNIGHGLYERAGIRFRTDRSDLALHGRVDYRKTTNTLQRDATTTTLNYGMGATITQQLPFDIYLESDITYSANAGYAAGFNQHETLWNASISWNFLQKKNATLRLKMYDLLQQRSNISYTTDNHAIQYSEQNTLTAYFMAHLVYRFTLFGGGASAQDMEKGPYERRGPRGQGPPGGGRRR